MCIKVSYKVSFKNKKVLSVTDLLISETGFFTHIALDIDRYFITCTIYLYSNKSSSNHTNKMFKMYISSLTFVHILIV